MSDRGTYYDPHLGLLYANYFDNRGKFIGIGNYTEEGFAAMEEVHAALTSCQLDLAIADVQGGLSQSALSSLGESVVQAQLADPPAEPPPPEHSVSVAQPEAMQQGDHQATIPTVGVSGSAAVSRAESRRRFPPSGPCRWRH